MKHRFIRLLLVLIFLITANIASISASEELIGFLGIPWGTNRTDFRQAMEKLGYSFYKEEELGNIKHQMYENGPYANYNVYLADAQFKGDAMYDGGIMIKYPSMPYQDITYIYTNIRQLLIEKYGQPTEEKKTWELKMGPNVGVTVTRAIWKIPNGDKLPNVITLAYTPGFYYPGDRDKRQWGNSVDVDYKNEALEKELDKGETARI
jgi:hypothetical protein